MFYSPRLSLPYLLKKKGGKWYVLGRLRPKHTTPHFTESKLFADYIKSGSENQGATGHCPFGLGQFVGVYNYHTDSSRLKFRLCLWER
jgi:hypothetical protein